MKRWTQQARRCQWGFLVGLGMMVSANPLVAAPLPADLRLDLRTDVGWEMDHFVYLGEDVSEALLTQAGNTVDLTVFTHKTVPHRCMLDFSHDYCDDRGYPDTWGRSVEPVLCVGTTPASRALLAEQHADANTLCVTFRGGFSYPAAGSDVAPDLATAIRRNPELEVLLINGIYDLATPYFAAVWTMDHMGLPADLRDNMDLSRIENPTEKDHKRTEKYRTALVQLGETS